jgi:1,2-diacylglycerol 3-beta-glucosyltransferase
VIGAGLRRLVGRGTTGVLAAGTSAVAVTATYLMVLTIAARGRRRGEPVATGAGGRTKFVVLIPAHDEEVVIGQALEALARLDYRADGYAVHVVADNCDDRTADIVRSYGVCIHERFDRERPGKGPALNWLLERLVRAGERFDAVVIIDADTSVHPAFLHHMDDAIGRGARAAQGYYGVRDPGTSTSAGLRYAALACRHHLRPLGRTRLGGSSGLYGNGMVFDAALMQGRQWSGHLIEDAEFQMELLLEGHKVSYVPDASVEAEMPDSLADSVSQNQRWELGRMQLARHYVPILIRRAVTGERSMRAAHVDAVFDHLVPPLSVVAALNGACTAGTLLAAVVGRRHRYRWLFAGNVLSGVMIIGHVVTGLRSVGAPKTVYRSLRSAPRLAVWKVGLWLRVLVRDDDVTWVRTSRNRSSA